MLPEAALFFASGDAVSAITGALTGGGALTLEIVMICPLILLLRSSLKQCQGFVNRTTHSPSNVAISDRMVWDV